VNFEGKGERRAKILIGLIAGGRQAWKTKEGKWEKLGEGEGDFDVSKP